MFCKIWQITDNSKFVSVTLKTYYFPAWYIIDTDDEKFCSYIYATESSVIWQNTESSLYPWLEKKSKSMILKKITIHLLYKLCNNCHKTFQELLQSIHLIVLDFLIRSLLSVEFWHRGWNHCRHFVQLNMNPYSGILQEQNNFKSNVNSTDCWRLQVKEGNLRKIPLWMHSIKWDLIAPTLNVIFSGTPPNNTTPHRLQWHIHHSHFHFSEHRNS